MEPLAIMAKEYVELLETQEPNAHGLIRHERYGWSHTMLYLMQINYGTKEASDAIDRAYHAHRLADAPV